MIYVNTLVIPNEEEPKPLGWSMFVMEWEWPKSWRLIKRRKFKQRHLRIALLEYDLGIIPRLYDNVPNWLWWYADGF